MKYPTQGLHGSSRQDLIWLILRVHRELDRVPEIVAYDDVYISEISPQVVIRYSGPIHPDDLFEYLNARGCRGSGWDLRIDRA